MVLKTGAIGPEWTAEKARRVSERLDRDPHLARVFPVLAELPLPDGSTAIVGGRRIAQPLDVPPGRVAEAIETAFRHRLGEVARDVDDLRVRLTYDDEIRRGRVSRIEVTAAAATVGEFQRRGAAVLRLTDVRVIFHDVLVNPYSAWRDRRFAPLDIGRLHVQQATISEQDLGSFLSGLRRPRASAKLEEGAVAIHLALPGPDVSARVRLPAQPGGFGLIAERVRVAMVPVPDIVAAWITRQFDPRPRVRARVLAEVTVAPITITPEALRIGGQ